MDSQENKDIEQDILAKELEQMRAEDEKAAAEQSDAAPSEHHHRRHHHHHHHSGKKRRRRRRHHHHRSSKERKKRAKRIAIISIILVLVLILAAGAIVFSMYFRGKDSMKQSSFQIEPPKQMDVEQQGDYIIYKGEKYRPNKSISCILFLGVDKLDSSQENEQIGDNHQSDVIAMCVIDSKNDKITIINVPRDIMTDVSVYSPAGGYVGRERMQIALAYAYGDGAKTSCLNAADAVSRLFYNYPIDTYFSMNIDGVPEINDAVGGVDVKSPETVSDFVKGETYHLEGISALHFVKHRDMERLDSNLLRNERQKVYLNAFLKKFISATKKDVTTAVKLFNASTPYSCTNLNADKITYLATEFIVNHNMKYDITTVPVNVKEVDSHAENEVKEEAFFEKFLDIFYIKET